MNTTYLGNIHALNVYETETTETVGSTTTAVKNLIHVWNVHQPEELTEHGKPVTEKGLNGRGNDMRKTVQCVTYGRNMKTNEPTERHVNE